jgi:hypothetical protein
MRFFPEIWSAVFRSNFCGAKVRHRVFADAKERIPKTSTAQTPWKQYFVMILPVDFWMWHLGALSATSHESIRIYSLFPQTEQVLVESNHAEQ